MGELSLDEPSTCITAACVGGASTYQTCVLGCLCTTGVWCGVEPTPGHPPPGTPVCHLRQEACEALARSRGQLDINTNECWQDAAAECDECSMAKPQGATERVFAGDRHGRWAAVHLQGVLLMPTWYSGC